MPPSLSFEQKIAERFFTYLKKVCPVQIVLEGRHATWASEKARFLISDLDISYVIADPPIYPIQNQYQQNFIYFRFHGSPKIYRSLYTQSQLRKWIEHLQTSGPRIQKPVWSISGNTAEGNALLNAL